jgi:hypothetical protein
MEIWGEHGLELLDIFAAMKAGRFNSGSASTPAQFQ